MVETRLPTLDADRLVSRLREDIDRRHGPEHADSGPVVRALENLIKAAEDRAVVRTRLPRKLDRFPFNRSKGLRRLFLKLYGFLFADQHLINQAMIQALGQAAVLIRTLQARVSLLASAAPAGRLPSDQANLGGKD